MSNGDNSSMLTILGSVGPHLCQGDWPYCAAHARFKAVEPVLEVKQNITSHPAYSSTIVFFFHMHGPGFNSSYRTNLLVGKNSE